MSKIPRSPLHHNGIKETEKVTIEHVQQAWDEIVADRIQPVVDRIKAKYGYKTAFHQHANSLLERLDDALRFLLNTFKPLSSEADVHKWCHEHIRAKLLEIPSYMRSDLRGVNAQISAMPELVKTRLLELVTLPATITPEGQTAVPTEQDVTRRSIADLLNLNPKDAANRVSQHVRREMQEIAVHTFIDFWKQAAARGEGISREIVQDFVLWMGGALQEVERKLPRDQELTIANLRNVLSTIQFPHRAHSSATSFCIAAAEAIRHAFETKVHAIDDFGVIEEWTTYGRVEDLVVECLAQGVPAPEVGVLSTAEQEMVLASSQEEGDLTALADHFNNTFYGGYPQRSPEELFIWIDERNRAIHEEEASQQQVAGVQNVPEQAAAEPSADVVTTTIIDNTSLTPPIVAELIYAPEQESPLARTARVLAEMKTRFSQQYALVETAVARYANDIGMAKNHGAIQMILKHLRMEIPWIAESALSTTEREALLVACVESLWIRQELKEGMLNRNGIGIKLPHVQQQMLSLLHNNNGKLRRDLNIYIQNITDLWRRYHGAKTVPDFQPFERNFAIGRALIIEEFLRNIATENARRKALQPVITPGVAAEPMRIPLRKDADVIEQDPVIAPIMSPAPFDPELTHRTPLLAALSAESRLALKALEASNEEPIPEPEQQIITAAVHVPQTEKPVETTATPEDSFEHYTKYIAGIGAIVENEIGSMMASPRYDAVQSMVDRIEKAFAWRTEAKNIHARRAVILACIEAEWMHIRDIEHGTASQTTARTRMQVNNHLYNNNASLINGSGQFLQDLRGIWQGNMPTTEAEAAIHSLLAKRMRELTELLQEMAPQEAVVTPVLAEPVSQPEPVIQPIPEAETSEPAGEAEPATLEAYLQVVSALRRAITNKIDALKRIGPDHQECTKLLDSIQQSMSWPAAVPPTVRQAIITACTELEWMRSMMRKNAKMYVSDPNSRATLIKVVSIGLYGDVHRFVRESREFARTLVRLWNTHAQDAPLLLEKESAILTAHIRELHTLLTAEQQVIVEEPAAEIAVEEEVQPLEASVPAPEPVKEEVIADIIQLAPQMPEPVRALPVELDTIERAHSAFEQALRNNRAEVERLWNVAREHAATLIDSLRSLIRHLPDMAKEIPVRMEELHETQQRITRVRNRMADEDVSEGIKTLCDAVILYRQWQGSKKKDLTKADVKEHLEAFLPHREALQRALKDAEACFTEMRECREQATQWERLIGRADEFFTRLRSQEQYLPHDQLEIAKNLHQQYFVNGYLRSQVAEYKRILESVGWEEATLGRECSTQNTPLSTFLKTAEEALETFKKK